MSAEWGTHCDPESYTATIENIHAWNDDNPRATAQVQAPTYAEWHAYRVARAPAYATNLQLPVTSGSSDGAFEELRHECQRLDTELTDTRRVLEGVRRGRASAIQDADSLGRQLEALQLAQGGAELKQQLSAALFRVAALEIDKEARDFDVAAAAAQFKAITGDFPGLTGPLVDLFKDLKCN